VGIASDPAIRRAVNTALNKEDILRAAYIEDDFVKPEGSLMISEGSEWYTQAGTEYYNPNDPEKAKAMLAEAGYNGETFRILVSSTYPDFYNAALVIQQNLEAIGVTVELNVVDWATYLAQAKDETAFDAYITSISLKAVPTQLYYLSDSAGWTDTDEKILEMKNAINTSSNKEEAIKTWNDLQEYFWSESVPTAVIGNKYTYSVAGSGVQGLIYFEGPHAWNVVVEE
jgi:peptide/nickel transport system substrate-binding protein